MDYYTANLIAQTEHRERIQNAELRSRVYDFGGPVVVYQPTWIVRQALRLVNGVKSGLVDLTNRKPQDQEISAGTSGVQTITQEIPC